jgi:uncharacterized membrane protein (Fun14 family)
MLVVVEEEVAIDDVIEVLISVIVVFVILVIYLEQANVIQIKKYFI